MIKFGFISFGVIFYVVGFLTCASVISEHIENTRLSILFKTRKRVKVGLILVGLGTLLLFISSFL